MSEPHRVIPVQVDVGLLSVVNLNPPPCDEAALVLTAQQDLQLLVTRLFALPPAGEEPGVVRLPSTVASAKNRRQGADSTGTTTDGYAPSLQLPRALPLPKPAARTRWQQFAAVKGIKKRKRSGKVYDEELQEWVGRHGGRSGKNVKEARDDWCVEVKDE